MEDRMESSIKLGRIWGIPIGLHWSWFLIFGLVTWSLAVGYFPVEYPELPSPAYWLLGALTSVLFFGSVLLHELGHTWVALRERLKVRGITLFLFGGVAQLSDEPRTPGGEFRVSIAGPLVSAALAVLFGALWLLEQAIPYLAAPSEWLARMNLMLALFNMIPGFPLDGGRVLRAGVWKLTGDPQRATKVTAITGQVFAFGFIALGVWTIFQGGFFNGLWLAFIGWFLQNAAATSYAQSSLQRTLHGVTVAQAMSGAGPRIEGQMLLDRLVEERILNGGQDHFLVAEGEQVKGVLTLREITTIPHEQWSLTTAEQAMVPVDRLVRLHPQTDLMAALRTMDEAEVSQAPVVFEQEVRGILSRERVLHYISLRSLLRA